MNRLAVEPYSLSQVLPKSSLAIRDASAKFFATKKNAKRSSSDPGLLSNFQSEAG